MPDNESPICPHCGATDLIVVYEAEVFNRISDWNRGEGENVWRVSNYDSQEVCDGYRNIRLECRTCGGTVATESETDTFVVLPKEEFVPILTEKSFDWREAARLVCTNSPGSLRCVDLALRVSEMCRTCETFAKSVVLDPLVTPLDVRLDAGTLALAKAGGAGTDIKAVADAFSIIDQVLRDGLAPVVERALGAPAMHLVAVRNALTALEASMRAGS